MKVMFGQGVGTMRGDDHKKVRRAVVDCNSCAWLRQLAGSRALELCYSFKAMLNMKVVFGQCVEIMRGDNQKRYVAHYSALALRAAHALEFGIV